jgi:hypothetical protein
MKTDRFDIHAYHRQDGIMLRRCHFLWPSLGEGCADPQLAAIVLSISSDRCRVT